jgi:hypothetical protein|nr:Imm42 family immunity protein [Kofleriaceae bacterium]
MPVIGNVTRFALEFEFVDVASEDRTRVWLNGRVGIWCGATRLGRFDLITSLQIVMLQIERVLRDVGNRANPRFRGLPARDVWATLNDGMYGGSDPSTVELADAEQWARHEISLHVDALDDWKLFVVDDAGRERVVWRKRGESTTSELVVSAGEVDAVLRHARDVLDEAFRARAGDHRARGGDA